MLLPRIRDTFRLCRKQATAPDGGLLRFADEVAMDIASYIPAKVSVNAEPCEVTIVLQPGHKEPWLATGHYLDKQLEAAGDSPDSALGNWTLNAWLIDSAASGHGQDDSPCSYFSVEGPPLSDSLLSGTVTENDLPQSQGKT